MFGNNNGFGNFSNNNAMGGDLGLAGLGGGQQMGGLQSGFGGSGIITGVAGIGANNMNSNLDFGDTPMMPTSQEGMQTVTIRKIFLTMTRRQRDQWRRNYEITATGQTLNTIADLVSQSGGQGVSNEEITSMMADQAVTGPNVFSYMGSPEAQAHIENGWNEQRFRFVLVADVFQNGRYRKTEFISGYTDEPAIVNAGMSGSQAISPNMQFIINNVTDAAVKRQHTSQGVRDFATITGTNAIVRDNGFSLSNTDKLWLMRPEDVLGTIDKLPLHDGIAQSAAFGEVQTHADLDSQLTGIPKMSARSSDMLTTYTSRLVSGAMASRLAVDDIMNEDGVGPGELGASRIREKRFSRGAFAFSLNQKCGTNTVTTATFSYGDLLRFDPTVDDRVSVFMKAYDTTPGLQVPDGSSVADIADAHPHSVAATMVANSIMSLMSQAGVSMMVYTADNDEIEARSFIPAFDGMDSDGCLAARVEQLRLRMQSEVINILSMNGAMAYNVYVIADVFNDVFVQLRIDGEERHYVVPAFASSHMAPLVTNDQTRLVDFARSMSDLVDTCVDHISNQNSGIITNGGGFASGNSGNGQFGIGDY